jgi:hypothetical protein
VVTADEKVAAIAKIMETHCQCGCPTYEEIFAVLEAE